MNFGVPNQRRVTTKVEKYPTTAVATLAIAEEGKGRKIYFNEKAAQVLNLPEENATVAFSFDNGITVVNGNNPGIPDEIKLNVSKSSPRRLSDKKTYDYITRVMNLDDSVENEFELIATQRDGIQCLDWQLMGKAQATTGEDTLYAAEHPVTEEEAFNPVNQ